MREPAPVEVQDVQSRPDRVLLKSSADSETRKVQSTAFELLMADRAIRWSTAGAVLCVAIVAAVVSYDHAYALVRSHGESGWTARLVPLTVDGLIYASSMVMLHSARHGLPVPQLARWLLGLGIAATLAANATHGLGHGLAGAIVAAWPAVALVGSYELLMMIIRNTKRESAPEPVSASLSAVAPESDPLHAQATAAFAADVASGRVPSIRTIRSELRVGQPKAQQVREHLAKLVPARGEA